MRVLVDMDDTLENLCEALVKYNNIRYGTSVKAEEINDWDLRNAFPDLTNDEIFAALYEAEFWKTVEPLPGATDYLHKLIKDGHDVYIVTASSFETMSMKNKYVLKRYFPYFDESNIIVAKNKQMIMGDVLIDDAPHNLVGGSYYGLLMSAPHNRKFDANRSGMLRVNSWEEAYKAVIDLSEIKSGSALWRVLI